MTSRATRSRAGLTAVFMAVVSLVACGGDEGGPTAPPPSASIQVSPPSRTFNAVGDTVRFSAVYRDAAGTIISGKVFTWSSSNPSVIAVDPAGLATVASGDGSATITATADGIRGSADANVVLTVASIDLNPANGEITALGATLQFGAAPRDGLGNPIQGKTVTWSSSDAAIAAVDGAGLATGIGIGTALITARVGTVEDAASLTVSQAGTGSASLHVLADVNANDAGALFTTDFSVRLSDAALAPISGATVTITNPVLGAVTLAETVAGSGIYQATRAGFPGGTFELDVVSGAHSVVDVIARGPGVHGITFPLANSTVPANQPLVVQWTVPTLAKGVELETRDFTPLTILPDTGAYEIPGANNPARPDQRIRVSRFNEVEAAGGLPGSRLVIKIRAQVEPVIVQ